MDLDRDLHLKNTKLQELQIDLERDLHVKDVNIHLKDLDQDLSLLRWNLPNRTLNQSAKYPLTCRLVQDLQEGTGIQVF